MFLRDVVQVALIRDCRADPREAIIVRALISVGRVPDGAKGHSPSSFARDLVVRAVGVKLIDLVGGRLRVLRRVVLVFPILCFVARLRRDRVYCSIYMVPVRVFAVSARVQIWEGVVREDMCFAYFCVLRFVGHEDGGAVNCLCDRLFDRDVILYRWEGWSRYGRWGTYAAVAFGRAAWVWFFVFVLAASVFRQGGGSNCLWCSSGVGPSSHFMRVFVLLFGNGVRVFDFEMCGILVVLCWRGRVLFVVPMAEMAGMGLARCRRTGCFYMDSRVGARFVVWVCWGIYVGNLTPRALRIFRTISGLSYVGSCLLMNNATLSLRVKAQRDRSLSFVG